MNEIEAVIKVSQAKKAQGQMDSLQNSTIFLKKELMPTFLKLFCKIETEHFAIPFMRSY